MKPKERFLTAVEQEVPDRVPVVYFGFGASETVLNKSHVTWKDLHEDGRFIEKVMLKAHQLWGFDNINVFVNAEFGLDALTGEKKFRYPFPRSLYREPFIKSEQDLEKLPFPSFQQDNTMTQVINAAGYLHKKVGNELALIGGFGGISTWALLLRGGENFFKDLKREVAFQKEYLKFLTEVAVEYSKAQIAAGCDYILTAEDLFEIETLGPKSWDVLGPYLKELADAIHKEGAYYILHCCGDCSSSSKEMLKTGADVLSVNKVNLSSFKGKVARDAALMGNIKTSLLIYRTPDEVAAACAEAIRIGKKGGGFLLSSGYICPPNTPEENMRTLADSTKRYGKY